MSEERNENNTDLMSSFMQTQATEQKDDSAKKPEPKKKNALEEARDKEEEEKKKELEDAKKNSLYNASKYKAAQASLMVAKGKSAIMAIPFIVAGILVFLVILKNGGSWVQGGTQFVMKKIRGE